MRAVQAIFITAFSSFALATQVNFYYDTSCKQFANSETTFISGYTYGGASGSRGLIYEDTGRANDWIVLDKNSNLLADKPAIGHCVSSTNGIYANLKCSTSPNNSEC